MPARAKLLIRVAANYEEMFAAAFKALEATPGYTPMDNLADFSRATSWVKSEIAWAKKTFKGNNAWVTWWLRWVRLSFEKMYLPDMFEKDFAQIKVKAGGELTAGWDLPNGAAAFRAYQRSFEHYMGTPAPGIVAYRPGWKSIDGVIAALQKIEKEWQDARKSILKPQAGDKIVIQFPDGWAWWFLPRNSCDEESRAMGHCGNGGSSDDSERILSLRQKKGGNDWEPHLTFILDDQGFLGEMKGKNNDKPVQRYHQYIIPLLENDIVKGVKGGGYLPKHNFSLDDLTDEEREALYEKKPLLMPIKDYYAKFGADETFVQKVKTYFKESDGDDIKWMPELQKFQIEEFKDLGSLVENVGNRVANWAYEVLSGDSSDLNFDSGWGQTETAENMLDDLTNDEVEKIGQILAHDYADQVADWLEEAGYDPEEDEFDVTDTRDIAKFAKFVGAEALLDVLYRARETGLRHGTEVQISKALESAIDDSPYVKIGDSMWDTKFYEALDINTILQLIGDNESLDDYKRYNDDRTVRMSEPNYGYDGYDGKAAIEDFHDNYDVDKEFRAAVGLNGVAKFEKEKADDKLYVDERQRLMDEIRSHFSDASPAVKQELKAADQEFRNGNYEPLVKMVRGVIPDAFPFATVEEPVAA